jgi:hypothetical protein
MHRPPPSPPHSGGARTPTNSRPNVASSGARFRNGVNPISRLYELAQQGKVMRDIEYQPLPNGPSHNQTWSASVIGEILYISMVEFS